MEVWIESDLAQALCAICHREGTSVTALVDLAVEEFLASMEDDLETLPDARKSHVPCVESCS